MSFFFGGNKQEVKDDKINMEQEVEQIFSAIQGIEDAQVAKMTTTITLEGNDIHGYYKINISDMFNNLYANIRPKNLEISIVNYNDSLTENVDVYYLHTPLKDASIDTNKLSMFSNHVTFTKKALIKNPQPYLTFCQVNENGEVIDVDISQTTNINISPDNSPFMSLGALIFQLKRNTTGNVTLELTTNLTYSIKKF